jgi:hypothetical protein
MSAILQTDSWVETGGGCSGPKDVRNQPSRESCGVLMTEELNDKFANQFNLPMRNLSRYIKEINSNWDQLRPEQKDIISRQLNGFNLMTKESFENDQSVFKYFINNPSQVEPTLDFLYSNDATRQSANKWAYDRTFKDYCNWQNILISFISIMILIIIGALIGYYTRPSR